MIKVKAQIAKGTRDFLPKEVIRRNYIFDAIKDVFETFGYFPIETPSFELLETLAGKYGEEGDRLLFKILNSGDFLQKANSEKLAVKDSFGITREISKKGLRYDLTVPFARFVVQHQNELSFPFKRYQIQPVWRADRPQKGRYQEFYQCDVDVIGSDSLMYEAELIQIYDKVFTKLGIDVEILLNNRKILAGIAEIAGIGEKFTEMTVAIDKLDKIGEEGVRKEMQGRGIEESAVNFILNAIQIKDIIALAESLGESEVGTEGIEEVKKVMNFLKEYKLHNKLIFDVGLARGLNYYTGCIFEVKGIESTLGSLGGGGRYAELTEVFGKEGMSGVGVSFGAERIYDLMKEKEIFPEELSASIQLLLLSFDEESHEYSFELAGKLREAGIKTDLYPEAAKMKKQMKFANSIQAPFVALVGEDERKSGILTIKNMLSGEQEKMTLEECIEFFGKHS